MLKLYWVIGALTLAGYLSLEAQGVIFGGTDPRPGIGMASSGGGSRGGGVFFTGSGYRGGK